MPSISQSQFRSTGSNSNMFEDISDRLNHVWTFGLLLFFACLIGFNQTVFSPISCWLPNEHREGNRQYLNDLCWNNHVITFPQDSDSRDDMTYTPIITSSLASDVKETSTLTLYQWVPVILVFQALLFKMPYLLLYIFHRYSGLCFVKLVALTRGFDRLNIAERRVLGNQIGRYIYNWCDQFGHCIPWRFLTLVYMLTKFLFCVNVIVQICLLDSFLKTPESGSHKFTSFSDVIIDNMFRLDKTSWKSSPAFPRMVRCVFQSPTYGRLPNVNCFLSMNVFSETIFVIVWVWFLFLSTITCTSLVSCLVKISVGHFRKRYIMKALALADNKEDSTFDHSDVAKFADWIGEDGIMALKFIGTNSSEILVSDIVCNVWKKRKRRKSSIKAGYIDMTSGSHSSPPRIKIHPVVTDMEN